MVPVRRLNQMERFDVFDYLHDKVTHVYHAGNVPIRNIDVPHYVDLARTLECPLVLDTISVLLDIFNRTDKVFNIIADDVLNDIPLLELGPIATQEDLDRKLEFIMNERADILGEILPIKGMTRTEVRDAILAISGMKSFDFQ